MEFQTVTVTGNTISGKLTYDNTASTPLSCCTIYLKTNTGVLVDSTETDLNGDYSFSCVPDGSYIIAASTTKAAGSINSIDALQVLKHFVGVSTLTGLPFIAGDVNDNGFINSADALLIAKRYTELITTFIIGDWVFEEPTVAVCGNNQYTVDFKGLCAGDVNRSYVPPGCIGQPCPNLPSF